MKSDKKFDLMNKFNFEKMNFDLMTFNLLTPSPNNAPSKLAKLTVCTVEAA
jgi:hypothetical protein